MSKDSPSVLSMVMLPAIITLVVTILRLFGELQGWDSSLFNPDAGGGQAPIGIFFLIPIFGFWFGLKHARAGNRPGHLGKAAMLYVLSAAAFMGIFFGLMQLDLVMDPSSETPEKLKGVPYMLGTFGVAALISLIAWPKLTITLMVYGILARIPVLVITYLDVSNGWDTHYGELPPSFLVENDDDLLFALCLPQMTAWPLVITPGLGGLLGCLGGLAAGKRS